MSRKENLKKHSLLRYLRREGGAGRVELAKALHISNSRVCDLVQDMLDDGRLIEEHAGEDRRGRRLIPVKLNPEYGHFVGFDMEAKRLRLVAVNFAGETVWEHRAPLPPHENRRQLIDALIAFITDGVNDIRSKYPDLLGIGLAGAGTIDHDRGVIMHYDLLSEARDIPLRDLVSSATGLTCIMLNNIRALTLAEWMNGAGRHLTSLICLSVRSGVSTGFVLDDRLYMGSHGFAGEAGTATLPLGAGPAQWKRLQDVVSEKALDVDPDDGRMELTSNQADRAGRLLGVQLAAMASLLDPQGVVLAGALIHPEGPLHDPMVQSFRSCVTPELLDRMQLLPARLGPFAAAVGATHRLFQKLHPVEPGAETDA